jgi:hypothetical protein
MTHREMFPQLVASPWVHSKKCKNFTIASCGLIRFRIDHGHQRGGRLAQLVERLVYTEDVGGSSPSSPTMPFLAKKPCFAGLFAFLAPFKAYLGAPFASPCARDA